MVAIVAVLKMPIACPFMLSGHEIPYQQNRLVRTGAGDCCCHSQDAAHNANYLS